MNITDQLLSALMNYGLPVLFSVIFIAFIASAGIPLPVSLLLIAAGSFVEQGDMNFWQVLLVASAGAILGDQVGYGIGRWGGRRFAKRLGSWLGDENRLLEAVATARKWGGISVFLTRWLLTPLGSWTNLASGISEYSWPRFLIWSALGEALWVTIYVSLGRIFNDRVQAMSDWLGNLTWVVIGLIAAIFLGWRLFNNLFRSPEKEPEKEKAMEQA